MKKSFDDIVLTWVARGIEDLYISTMLLDKFPRHRFTLLQQSIEKLSKACILGFRKPMSMKEADEIAQALNHDKFISELNKLLNGELKAELSTRYFTLPTRSNKKNRVTGWQLLRKFSKLFSESRYPSPQPHNLGYPFVIRKGLGWDMFHSSDIDEVCKSILKLIFKAMKDEIGIPIPKKKPSTSISDYGWRKFSKIYLAQYQS